MCVAQDTSGSMGPGDVGGSNWKRYSDPNVRDTKLGIELKNGERANKAMLPAFVRLFLMVSEVAFVFFWQGISRVREGLAGKPVISSFLKSE